MNIKITGDKQNPLLKRRELTAEIDYEKKSTPSKMELQKFFSEKLSAEMNRVEISRILSHAGLSGGRAWIKIWEEKNMPIYSEINKEKPKEERKEEKAVEEKAKKD